MLDKSLNEELIVLGSYLLDEDLLKIEKKEYDQDPKYVGIKKRLSATRKKIGELREGIGAIALQIFDRDHDKTVHDFVKIQERDNVELIEDEDELIEWCVKKELLGFLALKIEEFKEAAPHIKPDAIQTSKKLIYTISNKGILEEAKKYSLNKESIEVDEDLGF